MIKYEGRAVYSGIAIGKVKVIQNEETVVKRKHIENIAGEKNRFDEAKKEAANQLSDLYEKVVSDVGKAGAAIFEVHQMMLDDFDYLEYIYQLIVKQKVNAEYAVAMAGDNFSSIFAMMDDDYMKARASDIKDISERLIRILCNQSKNIALEDPAIIIADDLTPSDTVQLNKDKVLAFVTAKGSVNSHTAILARMMNIPAIIGTNVVVNQSLNGIQAVVNGFTGTIYIDPEEDILNDSRLMQEEETKKRVLLEKFRGKDNITIDGKRIKLYANIGDVSDLGLVLKNDSAGIGLFRTEFLYMGRDDYPTEEEQFLIYKQVAETMHGKPVIIRTLDIGADKKANYFELEAEENPAMGYRAIRICLERQDIFKDQLRAIFRASAYGNISIMYPMIISVEEVDKIQDIVNEIKSELNRKNIRTGKVEQGIMIETPAAVMISDLLAAKVDFFSIGTNDLTQYTLAIDRQNQNLENFYNPYHEAVLRMISLIIKNAHKEGKWVGICGELASDLALTKRLLMLGVDELSVSAPNILPIRELIRNTDLTKEEELESEVMF